MSSNRILIIGAGPTGLGAARRLEELGHHDWFLVEGSGKAGGLASSFVDEKGFTWDIGGHVQFSHYEYFDRAMVDLLGSDGWLHHERESWVWMRDRFVPYPFQNNIRHLPVNELERCLAGLRDIAGRKDAKPVNFKDWILTNFGQGVADVFMLPYNFKVWAYPPEIMSAGWVSERVAVPDIRRVLQNIEQARDDVSWGPNDTFQFPLRGGTGAIWKKCAERLPQDRLHFGAAVTGVDLERREVEVSDGRTFQYDTLISTIPLRELISLSGQSQLNESAEQGLLYSSSNIFGIGLQGRPPETLKKKCWMYFPEDDCPFYRVTVFSNYSPNNVPDIDRNWSLMAEVSESPHKPVNQETLLEEVIQGLLQTRLIERREDIVSTWKYRARYGYPTPGLKRDSSLAHILPFFEAKQVYSRGRFGLWKYEVSNQDHSFMQGVELVERLINGRVEVTAPDPHMANSKKHPGLLRGGDKKEFVNVTLLGNYPHDENESMDRYAEMLQKLLLTEGIKVEIIRPEPFFGRLKRSSQGLGKWLGYIDKYLLFPFSLRRYVGMRKNTDGFLVHICDHSNAVYTQWLRDVPNLVTCHDVMAIQSARGMILGQRTSWTGRLLQSWILSGLKRAAYVICVTPETRQDLLHLAPEIESRSMAVELPLNYPYAPLPEALARAQLDMVPDQGFRPGVDTFLFHVGGNQWYKNREGVIRIYARLCEAHPDFVQSRSLKLVMAGKPPTEEMLRLVRQKGVVDRVIFFTTVSNQQLCAFYTLAEALIYPSLKEGFGWPIVEAQACGCPVVTSNRAPMARLAGPAGLSADPEDEELFAECIFRLLRESTEAKKLRKDKVLTDSKKFNNHVFLTQVIKFYDQVLKKK